MISSKLCNDVSKDKLRNVQLGYQGNQRKQEINSNKSDHNKYGSPVIIRII